jgi:hypothetical protein
VTRNLNLSLPRCPEHPGSTVRADGTQGDPPRQRLRCFYAGADGVVRKHGFTPSPDGPGAGRLLFGGRYTAADVAEALVDVARGATYTQAARRARLVRTSPGTPLEDDVTAFDGRTVAAWVDTFARPLAGAHAETSWPAGTLVLDSTEFRWTNPRTNEPIQLFTVLAAWGYPDGSTRGRLWALAASPSDGAGAWVEFLRRLPGKPQAVVYDSDKAIAAAVPQVWPDMALQLCEHHLYENGRTALRADGQHGMGNLYRGLLAQAAASYTGWSAFRNAVRAAPELAATNAWVDFWDAQMSAQTARRPNLPPHYSTGALDPHIAKVRTVLATRAWTFRNLARMNALLGLVRLSINLCDRPSDWASVIARAARTDPTVHQLDEPANILQDGARIYSLRMHPVPPRQEPAPRRKKATKALSGTS